MGMLSHHPVKHLAQRRGCVYFVETGTWKGDGLLHALKQRCFVRLYSIEANPELAIRAGERLNQEWPQQPGAVPGHWEIICGDSADALAELLPRLTSGPRLWWLDAHLPERYAAEATRLPLEAELEAVVAAGGHGQDVFLLDDWRLYERAPYASGPWPHGDPPGDARAVRALLAGTHTLRVDARAEGALVALPKNPLAPLKFLR